MQNTKTLWLDVDGVILDYTRAFLKFTKRTTPYEHVVHYDLSKLFTGGAKEMLPMMEEFHMSRDFANLAPIANAAPIKWLKMLGWKVKIITQLEGIHPRFSRLQNLGYYFHDLFDEVLFTSRGESKIQRIIDNQGTEQQLFIVEDNPTLLDAVEKGIELDLNKRGWSSLTAWAIVHPYNEMATRDYKNVMLCKDLTDVIQDILSYELENGKALGGVH